MAGCSPVFVGLIYEIIVFDDPNGGELALSLLAEPEGRLLPFGADWDCDIEGSEATDFSDRPVWSGLTHGAGLYPGEGVAGPLDAGVEGSNVRDLRIATGFGEMMGGEGGLAPGLFPASNCHLSNTVALRPVSCAFSL